MRRVIVIGLVGLASCFNPDPAPQTSTDVGTDTEATGEGSTSDDPSTSTGADPSGSSDAACGACVAEPPAGWTGPLAMATGQGELSCAAPYTGQAYTGFMDIAAEAASCSCACGSPEVECGELSLRYDTACAPPIAGAESFMGVDTCHEASQAGPSLTAFFTPIAGTEACPPAPTVELPDATFTSVMLCGGSFEQGTCGADELCAGSPPDGFDGRICIARLGEFECPAEYPDAQSIPTDLDDTRGCSSCSCSAGDDFECSTALQTHAEANCGGAATPQATDECLDSFPSFTFDEPSVTGSCTPSSVEASGEVVGDEPLTICCQ